MLKRIKLAVLSAADAVGFSQLTLRTSWRQRRLLILSYHGISLEDEHEWDPSLYMSPTLLRERFEQLKHSGCTVLPLGAAVQGLYAGNLPPRAVSITFDDGFFDFYARALPIANEYGFPLTVYQTTYYSYRNYPVFDLALKYILWKSQGKTLDLPEACHKPTLLTADSMPKVAAELYQHVTKARYSGEEKNQFLGRLSTAAGFDFDELCRKRLLHLMTPEEVSKAAAGGADVQLHTHRHRVSSKKEQFQGEVSENREKVEAITHKAAEHFCYPSGFFIPAYEEWLQEMNIKSATTCIPGVATPSTSPLFLPRLVDTSTLTSTEFGGWISGLASLLPQRRYVMDKWSFLEAEAQTVRSPASI
jgi:peptidoglycan/xylan/chitin deacetylase (PgdA/CDA1 family)